MKYRAFKDIQVSEIGLGTWQLGSAEWGNVNEDEAFAIIDEYVKAGGNFVDTADVYGAGISETLIGKYMKSVDHEIHVATKLGRRSDAPNGWPQNFTYDAMKRQVEESLEHLQFNKLFLEQLHCIPTDVMREGKVFDHLRKLHDEDLIRYWGASVETSEEALLCLEQEGIASLQIIFNLFRQHVADEIFEKAREKNVALIIRVPLASGLLSGKFEENTTFGEKDHRNFNRDGQAFNAGETFSGIEFKKGIAVANEMKTYLPDDKMAEWALRWILDFPEVTTVIPGATKASQVQSNVAASELPMLPVDTHIRLRHLYDEKVKPEIRGHY